MANATAKAKERGSRPRSFPIKHRSVASYQGTILRSPFFFLLVDSFWLLLSVPLGVALCVPSAAFVPSALCAGAGAAASPVLELPAVPVGVVVVTGFVAASGAAG